MAVIRNTAAMRLRGKVGNTTYYTQGRRQLARVSENSSNYGEEARRSPAQQARRVKWSNLVQFFRLAAPYLKGAFETKLPSQSDYNVFMAKNLPNARINLTKEQALQGCCVLDTFMISEGSLRQVNLQVTSSAVITDLPASAESTAAITTIKALFNAIKAAWPALEENTQLTIFSTIDASGVLESPKVEVRPREVTLRSDDNDTIAHYLDSVTCHVNNGVLEFHGLNEDGYYAVILSNSNDGHLRTSTAVLQPGDTSLAIEYRKPEREAVAIQSYGVDQERFLDSGSPAIY